MAEMSAVGKAVEMAVEMAGMRVVWRAELMVVMSVAEKVDQMVMWVVGMAEK